MAYYFQFVFVGFIHHRFELFHGHLVVVDEFDAIHSGFGQLAYFVAGVFRAVYPPAEQFCTRIRFFLDKRSRDIKSGPIQFARIDGVAYGDGFFQRCAQVAG